MDNLSRPFALVTGASSGIGYELARQCADNGYDLVIAADRPEIHQVAIDLEGRGVSAKAVEIDLATIDGVDRLLEAARGRPVDLLCANAGHGLGGAFLDQEFAEIRHVIDTNVLGTIYLVHRVGRMMRARGAGRILITGSIAGYLPGAFQLAYAASKAFLDNFAGGLRNELKDSGVTVTCLEPGPTDTDFFARANMLDTKVGTDPKDNPADVAKAGLEGVMRGEAEVVIGWRNRLMVNMAGITPAPVAAEQSRQLHQPRH